MDSSLFLGGGGGGGKLGVVVFLTPWGGGGELYYIMGKAGGGGGGEGVGVHWFDGEASPTRPPPPSLSCYLTMKGHSASIVMFLSEKMCST